MCGAPLSYIMLCLRSPRVAAHYSIGVAGEVAGIAAGFAGVAEEKNVGNGVYPSLASMNPHNWRADGTHVKEYLKEHLEEHVAAEDEGVLMRNQSWGSGRYSQNSARD